MAKQFYLKVSFDMKSLKFNTNIVTFNESEEKEKLQFFYKELKCRTIDIVEYNKEVDLVVDDEGLLVSGNPVFDIASNLYKENLKIAGNILFAKKNVSASGNIDTVGFETEKEAWEFASRLNMTVIGVTN